MTSWLHSAKQRRAPQGKRVVTLSPSQIRWLGALLLSTQLPMIAYVPLWVALLGTALVGLRFLLVARSVKNRDPAPQIIRSWILGLLALVTAIAIRHSLGYFIGRDPCVAFLFALIGIKYLETRNARDGTLIVCLACLLIVTPFFYSQSLLATALAVPAVVLMGGVLQTLARPDGLQPLPGGWRAPIGATLRMLAQGIPLAATLFILFPRIAGPLWSVPADHAANSGLSDHMAPGVISELSMSDAVAFRVDFEGPIPPPWVRYWRGPVLSHFDGREWTMGAQKPTAAFTRSEGAPVIYTVTLEPHWKQWLFALDLPASLPQVSTDASDLALKADANAVLTRDQQIIARFSVTQALRYQQTSNLRTAYVAPSGAEREQEIEENLELPESGPNTNPRTLALAREIRSTHRDDAGYIEAVLEKFNKQSFFYTLAPPLLGANPVDGFLFDTRRGFCEHYASAFVVLLRAAGIPARVVTGYQGGSVNPNGDYLIVRQSDAHAWAEALIGDQWRRFDPTAAIAPSRIQLGLGGAVPASDPIPTLARLDDTFLKSFQLSWDAINHGWRSNVIGFNFERQRALWREWRLNTLAPWQITTIVLIIAAVWIGALLGWLAWRRRRQDRARALWDAMCVRLARAGLPRAAHEGPVDYVARAASRWPELKSTFTIIGESYAALRYGPAAAQPDTTLERASALWRLKRALALVPAPSTLRASPIPSLA
jgi:transglutaminase-like putative cysteine protease